MSKTTKKITEDNVVEMKPPSPEVNINPETGDVEVAGPGAEEIVNGANATAEPGAQAPADVPRNDAPSPAPQPQIDPIVMTGMAMTMKEMREGRIQNILLVAVRDDLTIQRVWGSNGNVAAEAVLLNRVGRTVQQVQHMQDQREAAEEQERQRQAQMQHMAQAMVPQPANQQ